MKTVAVLSAIAALANAHATFQYIWKNGEDLESTCARLPPSNSPVEDYTGTALQCNVNPAAASGKCSFEAGDTVTVEMHQHNTRECTEEGIGGAHWGPVLAYMSAVDDASTADGSSEFFKVYQNTWKKNPDAAQGDQDFWGTKDLNYNCGKLDFKIPTDIAPGDYLLRAEAIALHAAGASGGAQHYMTCYQLTVTGSGSLVPKGVKFPEAYSKTGPGLGFSIHADLSEYPAPGPALIAGGTEAAPQLLTFGKISGAPAATGNASEPTASSTKVAEVASSTKVVEVASSTKVAEVASSSQAPASTSAVVEAEPTVVSSANSSSAVASSTDVLPTEAVTTVEPESTTVLTSELPTVVAPFPTGNSTAKPTATGAPILSASSSLAPAVPSTFATSVRPQPTDAATGPIKEYYQCGGQNFKGTATCAEGLECKEWSAFYSQCVKPEATKPGPSKGPMPTSAAPKPTSTAPAKAEPTVVAPADNDDEPTQPPADSEPTEKTYTLETFIAFLEEKAGSESAAKMRRMIEALQ